LNGLNGHNPGNEIMNEERQQYLRELAENYDIDEDIVFMLAGLLGENEDYDGLITSIEDIVERDW
jgi:hypothetical protein